MSEAIRYDMLDQPAEMDANPKGEWVRYESYEAERSARQAAEKKAKAFADALNMTTLQRNKAWTERDQLHARLSALEEAEEREIRHLEWVARRRMKKFGQDGLQIQMESERGALKYHLERIKKYASKLNAKNLCDTCNHVLPCPITGVATPGEWQKGFPCYAGKCAWVYNESIKKWTGSCGCEITDHPERLAFVCPNCRKQIDIAIHNAGKCEEEKYSYTAKELESLVVYAIENQHAGGHNCSPDIILGCWIEEISDCGGTGEKEPFKDAYERGDTGGSD